MRDNDSYRSCSLFSFNITFDRQFLNDHFLTLSDGVTVNILRKNPNSYERLFYFLPYFEERFQYSENYENQNGTMKIEIAQKP